LHVSIKRDMKSGFFQYGPETIDPQVSYSTVVL